MRESLNFQPTTFLHLLTGELKELSIMSKTKDTVVPAGPFLLLPPWKENISSKQENFSSSQSSNLSIAILDLRGAMVVTQLVPSSMLRQTLKSSLKTTHTPLRMEAAKLLNPRKLSKPLATLGSVQSLTSN